ncbi:hypothetical protein CP082626L3_0404A, partial [Chlamydia psittaci 08-2626_L3]
MLPPRAVRFNIASELPFP